MYVTEYKGVHLIQPYEADIDPDEFDKIFYDLLYSNTGVTYCRKTESFYNEDEIVAAFNNGNGERISFCVDKKIK